MNARNRSELVPGLPDGPHGDGPPARICVASPDVLGPVYNGGIGTGCTGLARAMADAGHDVTLLYANDICQQLDFDHWEREYRGKGIRFAWLPPDPPTSGVSWARARSARTYQWMRDQDFDVIHLVEHLGVGHACLEAKRQGLAFGSTTFCTTAYSSARWHREGNRQPIRAGWEVEVDFLERQSIALSDVVVSNSQYLIRWMLDRGYQLPAQCYVQPACRPGTPDPRPVDEGPVQELVFFGRLEVRKGLLLFCDAVERAFGAGGWPASIRFAGKSTDSVPPDSVTYLQGRTSHWPTAVAIQTDLDHEAAMALLRRPGRLPVMPSLRENAPFTVLECLEDRVPFLASTVGGIAELIAPEDRRRVLFEPDPAAMATKLRLACAQGLAPARPAFDRDQNIGVWDRWHRGIKAERRPRPSVFAVGQAPQVTACVAHLDRPVDLIRSLAALDAQHQRAIEVIVVDRGKSGASGVLDELGNGIRVIKRPGAGLGAAWDEAATLAAGDHLLFLQDRDEARPDALARLIGSARRLGAGGVTCWWDEVDEVAGYGPLRRVPLGGCRDAGLLENTFGDAFALIEAGLFRRLGGFARGEGVVDPGWDFWARAVLLGANLVTVPEPLFTRRVDHPSTTIGADPDWLRVQAAYEAELPPGLAQLVGLLVGSRAEVARLQRERDEAYGCASMMSAMASRPEALRYRVVDALNAGVKRLPLLHGTAKSTVRTIARARRAWRGARTSR